MTIHRFKIEAIDDEGFSTQIETPNLDLDFEEDIEVAIKQFVKLLIKVGAELPEEIEDML